MYLHLWPQLYRIGRSINARLMGIWTVVWCTVWFYMYGSECIEVSEAQSVVLSSHSIIIINHSFNTLRTLAKLLAAQEINLILLTCMASLRATSSPPSSLINPSCYHSAPSLLFPSHPPPPHCYRQCFCLFLLTVYLIQSKLLQSFQTSITASHNPVVYLSITPHFPPLYVGVALHHCMTDCHFTLSSRSLF